jgi:hypothetical protein
VIGEGGRRGLDGWSKGEIERGDKEVREEREGERSKGKERGGDRKGRKEEREGGGKGRGTEIGEMDGIRYI